jgi:hypothetical protein
MTLLVLSKELEVLWIEEAGVRIESPSHPRDGALVDGTIRRYLLGEVLFHRVQDPRELFETGLYVVL